MTSPCGFHRSIGRAVVAPLLATCLFGAHVFGQPAMATEYEIKAAYLLNFARFVEWPGRSETQAADSVAICVLGADPFGATLDGTLAGAKRRGRNVVARRVATASEAVACHVLFVSASEEAQMVQTVEALRSADVLTVSDHPQFLHRGGIIQFVKIGSRVRFEIDVARAKSAGLTMSAELLRVASAVRRRDPTE